MNRVELQRLAQQRITEAKVLLAAKQWSGAYYLVGYAVECGLKSCILAFVKQTGIIFTEKNYAERCWAHDLDKLLQLAGLEPVLGVAMVANAVLRGNWATVKQWREVSRYFLTPHDKAKKLFIAITDKPNGVMQWMKDHW